MKKIKDLCVGIFGATGAVGKEMVSILEERDFPVGELRLFATERSAGENISFRGRSITVSSFDDPEKATGIDIALLSAGATPSLEISPLLRDKGILVIDNSSAFRMDPAVPLVVPEINPSRIPAYPAGAIIANPNCATIQMLLAIKPLIDAAGAKRVVVTTFQSVSGTGKDAMEELASQLSLILNGRISDVVPTVYPHQIAFNVLPHIDSFLPDGYTKEEEKMVNETRKILEMDHLRITATTVRVPVMIGHSEAVNIELERDLSPETARKILQKTRGVKVLDNPLDCEYPLPMNVAGQDDVYVGRIRRDFSVDHGLNLWVVGDNLRKGAALNAVQIAECSLGISGRNRKKDE
ncbi:MAG: aspartate-semialdehyde dehydrogenase [Leptospirillum sp.]